MVPTNPNQELITFRVPRALADEVRRLAVRDTETAATIIRRLLRSGLEVERRSAEAGQ